MLLVDSGLRTNRATHKRLCEVTSHRSFLKEGRLTGDLANDVPRQPASRAAEAIRLPKIIIFCFVFLKQPVPNVFNNAAEAVVTDPLDVNGRHTLNLMAHYQIHGNLISRFPTDSFKAMPEC